MSQLFPSGIVENAVECCYAQISIDVSSLVANELMKINGENFTFFLPSDFSDGMNIPLYSYLAEYKSQLTGF